MKEDDFINTTAIEDYLNTEKQNARNKAGWYIFLTGVVSYFARPVVEKKMIQDKYVKPGIDAKVASTTAIAATAATVWGLKKTYTSDTSEGISSGLKLGWMVGGIGSGFNLIYNKNQGAEKKENQLKR